MGLASTIIAIVLIVAVLAGCVYFIYITKDKNKPSYMATPKVKATKEEKLAAKSGKKAEKAEKAAAKKSKKK